MQWVWLSFHPGGKALSSEELVKETEKIIRRVDSNGDGLIDYAEFEAYARAHTQTHAHRKITYTHAPHAHKRT